MKNTSEEIKKIVYENLDNANENGEFEPDGNLIELTAGEIADDLIHKASDCEELSSEEMIPHIQAWLNAKDAENNDFSNDDEEDLPYESEDD